VLLGTSNDRNVCSYEKVKAIKVSESDKQLKKERNKAKGKVKRLDVDMHREVRK
jgi:predicted RNA-binding protein